jgi:hypothetical protein
VNQLELIDEMLALVIAGDDAIPSDNLMTHAMRQGWILKLSESFSVSHFKEHPLQNEAQKRLLKDVHFQIFRGYLRDSLPDQAITLKKEMSMKRLSCARRFATIFTDPEGPFFNKEERRFVIQDLDVVYMSLFDQGRSVSEKMPNFWSEPLHEDAKEMTEDWLIAVLNEMDVDVSEWVGSYLDEDCGFVLEFASHLRLLIKPHEPDCGEG